MIHGAAVVRAAFLCGGLATFFTCLRLYTRIRLLNKFGLDDVLLIIALAHAIAVIPLMLYQYKYGMGEHINNIPHQELVKQLIYFWASTWVYTLGIIFVKLCVLVQFYRAFVHPRARCAIWFIIFIVVVCGLITVFGGAFACVPLRKFWDHTVPGKCINYYIIWYLQAAAGIVSDIGIVVVPIPTIIYSNMERRRKWTLLLALALAGFGWVSSFVRLCYLIHLATVSDSTYYNPMAAIWSVIELNIIIVCVSFIALYPLQAKVAAFLGRLKSRFSRSKQGIRRFSRSEPGPHLAKWGPTNTITTRAVRDTTMHKNSLEEMALKDGIKVETTIDFAESRRESAESSISMGRRLSNLSKTSKPWDYDDIELPEIV